MTIRIGIIQFPGSNCEFDAQHVCADVMGFQTDVIWHESRIKPNAYQCIILPGGFSYGDYLRSGSMAILSPVIHDVVEHAEKGGLLLGICNGFQTLTELKLLPGALLTNTSLNFSCRDVYLRIENAKTPYSCAARPGAILKTPIAHGQGCYFIDNAGLKSLRDNQQILFRYCDAQGRATTASNPNGSLDDIAGVTNKKMNVMGLMPHPERCSESILGGDDGKVVFDSIKKFLSA